MLKLNSKIISQEHFPDGTLRLGSCSNALSNRYYISWYYDNDSELFSLICLVKKLREYNPSAEIYLEMPYIPHARMDRVYSIQDTFTLKYFSQIINDLNFNNVWVLNPHSNVSTALINRRFVCDTMCSHCFNRIDNIADVVFFYPDEGAAKKFTSIYNRPYAIGMKKRDWKSGKIESYEIIQNEALIKDKDILIIDDICSKGGTFYFAAKRLKEIGARNIYLYIDHCENSVLDGELIKSDLIEKIYTTDSIYTGGEHPMIEIVESFRTNE